MGLLRELEIGTYRDFRGVRFEDFGDINLIVGANNAGKSSVIEAIGLVFRPVDPGQWVQTSVHRDVSASLVDSLWGIFPGAEALTLDQAGQTSRPLEVKATLSEGDRTLRAKAHALTQAGVADGIDEEPRIEAMIRLDVHVTGARGEAQSVMEFTSSRERSAPTTTGTVPLLRVFTVTPFTHRSTQQLVTHLSYVIDADKKSEGIEMLRLFDPDVRDVAISRPFGRSAIRIIHASRGVVDLSSFGDGMRRAFALALALVRAERGILLVDELEEGVHPSALPKLASWLVSTAAQVHAQVIATTHSLETVDAVLQASEETTPDPVVAYHLRRSTGSIDVQRLAAEDVRFLRNERALDIR